MARLKESRWVYILLSIVLAIVFIFQLPQKLFRKQEK